ASPRRSTAEHGSAARAPSNWLEQVGRQPRAEPRSLPSVSWPFLGHGMGGGDRHVRVPTRRLDFSLALEERNYPRCVAMLGGCHVLGGSSSEDTECVARGVTSSGSANTLKTVSSSSWSCSFRVKKWSQPGTKRTCLLRAAGENSSNKQAESR